MSGKILSDKYKIVFAKRGQIRNLLGREQRSLLRRIGKASKIPRNIYRGNYVLMVSRNKIHGVATYVERAGKIFIINLWTNPSSQVVFHRHSGRTIGTELISHLVDRHKPAGLEWSNLFPAGESFVSKAEAAGLIEIIHMGKTPLAAKIKKQVKPILPVTPINKVARKPL